MEANLEASFNLIFESRSRERNISLKENLQTCLIILIALLLASISIRADGCQGREQYSPIDLTNDISCESGTRASSLLA